MKNSRTPTDIPVGVIEYEEYQREWWVEFSSFSGEAPEEPDGWVVILHFNVSKLYRAGMSLAAISQAINEVSSGYYTSIASPDVVGKIEVYVDFDATVSFVRDAAKKKIPSEGSLVTEKTLPFFVCRDYLIDFLKSVRVCGITGVKGVFKRKGSRQIFGVSPPEDTQILDLELTTGKRDGPSVKRYTTILTQPMTVPDFTIPDDIHVAQSVYGIEFTKAFLERELSRLISFDGSYINSAHPRLLVEAMCVSGVPTSVGRNGISRDGGPATKILFEQAGENAAYSGFDGERDECTSFASAILFGKKPRLGTGVVELEVVGE